MLQDQRGLINLPGYCMRGHARQARPSEVQVLRNKKDDCPSLNNPRRFNTGRADDRVEPARKFYAIYEPQTSL